MADMDLGALLKRQSEAAKLAKLEYIDLYHIHPDPRNFYGVQDVEGMVESIRDQGLQQPLLVRTDPDQAGHVIVISGHRRLSALLKLDAAKGLTNPDPAHIPILRNDSAQSPEEQEWQLILGNKDSRQLTNFEIQKQAERVEKLLLAMAEQGHTFSGRTRDKVAQLIDVSKSKLSRLAAIGKHLAACWVPAWESGDLAESVAYALQKASEKYQEIIFEETKGDTAAQKAHHFSLDQKMVDTATKKMKAVDQLACPDGLAEEFGCANRENKLRKVAGQSKWWDDTPCAKCCAECPELGTCKYACPHLADQITELRLKKQEKEKEAQAKEKAEQEKRDREDQVRYDLAKKLWVSVANARRAAGISIEDCVEKMRLQVRNTYTEFTPEAWKECEDDPDTAAEDDETPYGDVWDIFVTVDPLVYVADMLSCSVDALLGRTEPGGWLSGHPKRGQPAAIKYTIDGADGRHHLNLAKWYDGWKFLSGAPMDCITVLGWSPVPYIFMPDVPESGTEPKQDAGWHSTEKDPPEVNRPVLLVVYVGDYHISYDDARWTGTSWVGADGKIISFARESGNQWCYIPERQV